MKTSDFTGTYDYERGQAQSEAEYFLTEIVPHDDPDTCRKHADRIRAHWERVLCPQGMADFRAEWNKLSPIYSI